MKKLLDKAESYFPKWAANISIALWVAFVYINYFDHFKIKTKYFPDLLYKGSLNITGLAELWIKIFFFMAIALFISVFAYCIGEFIVGAIRVEFPGYRKNIVSISLGYGVLAYTVFFIGQVGLLYNVILWIIPVIGALLSVKLLRSKKFSEYRKKLSFTGDWGLYWILVLLALLAISLIGCILPETFYDSLNYHLAMPEQYLQKNRIFPVYWNIYSFMPATVEMLFMTGISLGGDLLAKLINFSILLWILYFVVGFGYANTKNMRFSIMGAGIFLSTPLVLINSWNTQIEFGMTLFSLGALVCLLEYTKAENEIDRTKYLVLCGILLGFTMGSKYIGILNAVSMGLIVLIKSRQKVKRMVKDGLIISTVAVLVLSPWLIRNYIHVRNPVYPLMSGVFDSKVKLNQKKMKMFSEEVKHKRAEFSVKGSFLIPWKLTMRGMHDNDFLGVIYLSLFVLLILFIKMNDEIKWSIAYVGLLYVFWVANTHMLRFFIPGLAVLAGVFAVYLYKADFSPYLKKAVILSVGIVVWAQMFWVMLSLGNRNAFSYLWASKSKAEYLSKGHNIYPSPSYAAIEYINNNSKEDEKIIFLGDARTFNLKREVIGASVFDEHPFIMRASNYGSGAELANRLIDENINYIFINMGEIGRTNAYNILECSGAVKEVIDDFMKYYVRLVYRGGDKEFKGGNLFVYKVMSKKLSEPNYNILSEFL